MLPLCAGKGECNSENRLLGREIWNAQYSASAELMVNEDEHFSAITHLFL